MHLRGIAVIFWGVVGRRQNIYPMNYTEKKKNYYFTINISKVTP